MRHSYDTAVLRWRRKRAEGVRVLADTGDGVGRRPGGVDRRRDGAEAVRQASKCPAADEATGSKTAIEKPVNARPGFVLIVRRSPLRRTRRRVSRRNHPK